MSAQGEQPTDIVKKSINRFWDTKKKREQQPKENDFWNLEGGKNEELSFPSQSKEDKQLI